ncbi:type VII secretion system-associated protein [Streptomyces sp. ISID311]|uniref:type VII secretion system-associated protein n=1 Tax=Streptomyces sp. ISID311 TaxID=2601673 RepID=UPI0011BD3A51|nr:type VII secretion system-associated protein [Streptomyces sp. ISID311]TXC99886.1 type VII secretion system-associated protein [Streptomyces sp. ISID311]
MPDLTHLDAHAVQTFIDNDVSDFMSALEKIRKDDPGGVRALKSILDGTATVDTLDENQILAIGLMAGDDSLHGQNLIKAVQTVATSVDEILATQGTLFKDIDRDLRRTVKTLLDTQGSSLASIDGEKLLDVFSNVDSDLGASGKSTGGHS